MSLKWRIRFFLISSAKEPLTPSIINLDTYKFQDYNDDIRQEQMWEMQILSTQQGREGSYQTTDAPSSPETGSEAASSPTSSITVNSLEGQESSALRPSPSPPHPTAMKTQGTPLQPVTSTLGEHLQRFQLEGGTGFRKASLYNNRLRITLCITR